MASDDYDPFVIGQNPVGSRTWKAHDEDRSRQFTCEIWYPAKSAITQETDDNGELRDAEPLKGAHPLVVFSHFSGGGRRVSSFLCQHLASHGYAVAALTTPNQSRPNSPPSPTKRQNSGPAGSMRS